MKKFLFLLSMVFTITSLAGETIYSTRVDRSVLTNGDYNLVFDPLTDYHLGLTQGVDYFDKQTCKVKLLYNREEQSDIVWTSEWRYKVEYAFVYPGGTSPSETLEISSESGNYVYLDYALHAIDLGWALNEVTINVISVTAEYDSGAGWTTAVSAAGDPNLPADIHLELSVKNERYYTLNDTENTRILREITPETIDLKWYFVRGAEEYDLEWVYIDAASEDYDEFSASVTGGSFDPESPFEKKEPMGIRVNYNHFELDNVFDEGMVFFRVRPVGRFTTGTGGNFNYIKTGAWSYYVTRPDLGEAVTEPYLCYYEVTEDDVFQPNKTWLYTIGFAENGKFSSGVSYYDGSLRSRQGTAYNSTDDATLKSESKYDYEGRMAVSLPPAPVHGRNLAYEAGFNTVTVEGSTEIFDKSHFDIDNSTTFYTLNDDNGISKYFSENNDFDQENQSAIPDADGYVYGQVKYKNDGSGRVEESSGIGESFAMNGDHTTKYYYGSPTSTELRRLFGSNVSGNSNYYKKNMVQDANGQLSVAYTDGAGQTIATALAGAPPNNLIDLDGSVESYTTLLNEGNFITPDGNTLKSTFVFLNQVDPNTLTFNYDFTGIIFDFDDLCEPATPKCEDCLYEIGINIIAPDGTVTEHIKDIEAAAYTCGTDSEYDTDFDGSTIWTLPPYVCDEIGEYKIVKTLRLKEEEMLEAFTAAIDCPDRLNDMIDAYTESVDISGCFTNCDDFCAYVVGKDLGYTEVELEAILADPEDPFYSIPAVVSGINACKLSNCSVDEIFDGDLDDAAEGDIDGLTVPLFAAQCEGFYSQMAAQVRPGGYHYIDDDGTFWTEVQIAMDAGDITFYASYEEDGTPIGLPIGIAGQLHDGTYGFREEWVMELVTQHREYCHYEYCGDLVDSKQFDAEFGTYLMTEVGATWPATEAGISFLWDAALNDDPFIDLDFNLEAGLYEALQNYLESGYEYDGTTDLSIYEYIDEIVIDIDAELIGAGEPPLDDPTKWNLLRGLYTTAKQQLIDTYKAANGCDYFEDDDAIFMSGSDAPGVDDGGDGVIDPEDLAGFFEEFGDIFVPDVYEVCDANVASWMSSLPETCLTELEAFEDDADPLTLGTSALEAAFLDYCYEYCGPENPGGFFINHDPEGDPYPLTEDAKYYAVMDILATACPSFEVDFEVEAPETEVLDGIVNQDFPACYLHMLEYVMELITDLEVTDVYPITEDMAVYDCGETFVDDEKQWYLSDGALGGVYDGEAVFFNEQDAGGLEQPCSNFLGIRNLDGINWYLLTDVDAIDNHRKEIVGGVGRVVADITLTDGTTVVAEIVTNYGSGCYNPGNFDDMEIITDFPVELDFTFPDWEADCIDFIYEVARQNAINAYNDLISEAQTNFLNELDCFTGINEVFTMDYTLYEYQYTLFYYDQTGQLVQTVPPAGVDVLDNSAFPSGEWDLTEPDHKQKTIYTYNGAGQLQESETPDGGTTKFYYDDLYRLRFVQNALQAANNRFSYTKYDELGRAVEGGEAGDASLALPDLASYVNDNSFPSTTVRDYTKTYYEEGFSEGGLSSIADNFTDNEQKNLRGAVGAIEKYTADYEVVGGAVLPVAGSEFKTITSFSYDPHGQVKEMVQTNYQHALEENEHKLIEYEYDLISGNTQEVIYQRGELDEWRHAYHYDASNRLVRVFTSDDGEEWEMDAKYFYYLHGSLARVEKGHDKIQGMDFAYNLQGWLKGVNSTTLDPTKDIGQDANATGLDKFSGADVNGFSLGYYKDDYSPILGTNAFASTDYLMDENGTWGELFNGNISTMVTAMKDENEALLTTQGNIYQYDLLQRIKSMETYQVTDATNYNATNAFTAANASNTGKYATTYSFDGNGNLTSLTRKDQTGTLIDNFSYKYIDLVNKNQLDYVHDTESAGLATYDLDAQSTGNYEYDEIGQLIKDVEANIENINWTADGKVRKITFTVASGKDPIQYVYGAGGNRLVQITGMPNQPGTDYEYYVYDATGNLMATYTKTMGGNLPGTAPADYTETTTLKDRNIYGATRLGSKHENKELYSRHFNVTGGDYVAGQTTVSTETHADNFDKEKRRLGGKFYEMTNHLNNVLNVVSDRKLPNVTMTGYEADIASFSDYYPYGMTMPGRSGSSSDDYRYGFQGQEMDDEIKGEGNSVNYKYRMHDPRIGRFFAVDPLTSKYPKWSPYQFSGNQVVHTVELEGLENGDDKDPTENVSGGTNFLTTTVAGAVTTLLQFHEANTIATGMAVEGGYRMPEATLDGIVYFGSQFSDFSNFSVAAMNAPFTDNGLNNLAGQFKQWRESQALGYSYAGGFQWEASLAANPTWQNGLRFFGGFTSIAGVGAYTNVIRFGFGSGYRAFKIFASNGFSSNSFKTSTLSFGLNWNTSFKTITTFSRVAGGQGVLNYSDDLFRLDPIAGYVDILAHGSSNSILRRGQIVSIGDLANDLTRQGLTNNPIRLCVCNAGLGENSIAQQLANATGQRVIAPNGYLHTFSTGTHSIQNTVRPLTTWAPSVGRWVGFVPE